MMTDERQGADLFRALDRVPSGSGMVFRHYSLPADERRRLFLEVQGPARERGLLLMLGGEPQLAEAWGADGSHGRYGDPVSSGNLWRSAPVHNLNELEAAEAAGADFVFASPVFPTRSHPDAVPLGVPGFAAIASRAKVPVIALGGMDGERAKELSGTNIYGWAAIDAWSAGPD
jgi:thiamine-phosphate pyrophosphorylase